MRMTIALRVIGALLLLGGAVLARNEARLARSEASAWQQLLTFHYEAVPGADAPAGVLASATGADLDRQRREATVEYWLGRYDELADRASAAADPDVLFVAANAAYRSAWRDAAGPDGVRKLGDVIQAYAAVLKANPRYLDAAFNLEFVARRRDQIALQKPVPLVGNDDEPTAAGPIQTTDLPRGPTVHGIPGGPPVNVPVEEFKVLIPRDAGEQETEAGQATSGKRRRKG
ncbi:MAG TPA: hypothetical protein PLH72_00810 [Vicinamibacterales bacterium]|nr:hypothetical protein [Vicinamibacterales bacterium]